MTEPKCPNCGKPLEENTHTQRTIFHVELNTWMINLLNCFVIFKWFKTAYVRNKITNQVVKPTREDHS